MPELLLELLSEEIPARMQDRAAEDLKALVTAELAKAGLAGSEAHAYATPRRLVLVIDGLPSRQRDRNVERRGPRADAPKAARDGFLASLGGATYRLEEREEKKGRVLYALVEDRGRGTAEVLAAASPEILARFPWPKSMRWGSGDPRWVRPLHSIVCLFDGAVVPFRFGPVESGDVTTGHRFMAPETIRVRDFADYQAKLKAAKIVLDGAERRRLIADEAARLAEREGLRVKPDEGLLDELKGLVEWPVPLMGRIDEESMRLPPEVLTTSMRTHQRYLALQDVGGRLAPRFITVVNTLAEDGGSAIVKGNEYVLRARLWDARFFWEQDRKKSLDFYVGDLIKVVFHQKLGWMLDRALRLEGLAYWLAQFIPNASAPSCGRAGQLCKADLLTGMVGEFPELQGIMGKYYAEEQTDPVIATDVALALEEHYLPKGASDSIPTQPTSIAVALADRFDTLVGMFGIGEKPTGSKDPYALRRAALGIIRIIVGNRLHVSLSQAIQHAYLLYNNPILGREVELEHEGPDQPDPEGGYLRGPLRDADVGEVQRELLAFFADRLKVHLRGQGARHDLVSAVFAAGGEDDLVRLLARVEALGGFLGTDDGRNLLVAYRRASNIVGIEEKRDKRRYEGEPGPALLREPAERALYEALLRARERIEAALAAKDYAAAMGELADLRAPVDRFFDEVKVNADEPDLRVNRLLLLGLIRSALGRVADFGLIEDAGA